MKFIYEILKDSDETIDQLKEEGIKPKEKYGYYYVPLFPLLERDGELIDLWKDRYYDWVESPVKEEVIVELPDDELIEFYPEDFGLRHIDVTFRVKDIEMIVNEIYDYGKKHLEKKHTRMRQIWNGEANIKDWFGNDLYLDYTIKGIPSYIFQLGMCCNVCRYNDVLKLGLIGEGKKEKTNSKKTYEIRFEKIKHKLSMRNFDPMTDNEMLFQLYNMKELSAISSNENQTYSLDAELGKKHNRLTFQAHRKDEKMILLSSWSLATSNIGISVDMALYKKIDSIQNKTLNELWNQLRIPEQTPEWAQGENYNHNFFLNSAIERKVEDDEYLEMCKEIMDKIRCQD